MKRKLIGQVGVDSGQLMIIDPCYIDSEWKKDETPIGIKFWGQGQVEVADYLKSEAFNVLEENNTYSIMSEDSGYLLKIQNMINQQAKAIQMKVVSTFITDGTYDTICNLTQSENQSGQLNYRLGHEGLGVAFSSGFGDGTYDVYATYGDMGQWGERITKVEIILIGEEELEESL